MFLEGFGSFEHCWSNIPYQAWDENVAIAIKITGLEVGWTWQPVTT